jgi:hypothetical protein
MTSIYGFGTPRNAFLKPCNCEDYPCCGHELTIEMPFEAFVPYDRLTIPEVIEAIAKELAEGKSPSRAIEVVGCGWDADSFQDMIEAVRKVAIKVNGQHGIWFDVVDELWDCFYDQDWSEDDLYW